MTAADYAGIVTCIGALTGGITSVIVALRQRETKAQVEEIHTAVSTPNGATIGEIVAANDITGAQNGG